MTLRSLISYKKIPISREQDALNLTHCCKKHIVQLKAKLISAVMKSCMHILLSTACFYLAVNKD